VMLYLRGAGPRLARRTIGTLLACLLVIATGPVAASAAVVEAETVSASAITTANLKCLEFVTSTLGFAGGSSGTILKTTDGGATWEVVRSGGTLDIRAIDFWDASNGRAVAFDGTVLGTSNGGDTWITVNSDLGSPWFVEQVFDASFPSATAGHAVGWDTFDFERRPALAFETQDAGSTWPWSLVFEGATHYVSETNPEDAEGRFYGVDFVDASRGWAVGVDEWVSPKEAIIYDYDENRGGTKWAAQPVSGNLALLDVAFSSTTVGTAVGESGFIVRTTNGGSTWASVTPPAGISNLAGVDLGSNGWGWAVGANGKIIRTSNSGESWSGPVTPTGYYLEDVAWLEGTKGVAVGASGTILLTSNGVDWAAPDEPPPAPQVTSVWSTSHPASTWVADDSVDFQWTGSSSVTGYSYDFDQSASTVPDTVQDTSGTSASVTAASSGHWYLHVRATDGSDWSATFHQEVLVDITDPTASDNVDPAGYELQASVSLSGSDAHSGLDRIEYSLDSGSFTTYAGPVLVTGEGDHTLEYVAYDNAGNSSTTYQATVKILAPTSPHMTSLTSSSHPENTWVANTSISFSWEATSDVEITGYSYILDSSPDTIPDDNVEPPGLGVTLQSPGSGIFYMHVRAQDANDEWSETALRQVKVDVTAPTASDNIDAGGYVDSASVTLSASDQHSGLDRIEYSLDGGTRTKYTAPVSVTGAGTHTFRYWAVDKVNNEYQSPQKNVVITASPTDPDPEPVTDPVPVPVQGTDRYMTAIEASKLAFPTVMPAGPDGNRWVVLASGATWPDALAASGLAGAAEAPLLLTRPTDLPAAVAQEISRLGANRVMIVGGTGAVSAGVQSAVAKLPGIVQVKRIGGADRYATALLIADQVVGFSGRSAWDDTAFLGTGLAFPDALAAAPLATHAGDPLYLAPKGTLPPAIIAAMKADGVKKVVILGGTGAIDANTEQALKTAFGVSNVERCGGADRYATAVSVAAYGVSAGLTWAEPAVATGENFPDALAGGVMQGHSASILLLTRTSALSPATAAAIGQHSGEIREVRFLGGTGALSQAVRAAVIDAATP